MKNLITLTISLFFISNVLFATTINIPTDNSTIQAGINASSNGDTVLVAVGTYTENINYNGKNIVVQGEDRETTIIDGNQNGSVVTFNSGEDSTAVLSDFTITNAGSNYYGGVLIENSSPTIQSCIISENYALDNGGGISIISSNPKIINVSIIDNYTENDGGGIWGIYSSAYLENVAVINNSSGSLGGGIYFISGNPYLLNVTISGNTAGTEGGGIRFASDSNPTLTNVTITGNSAGQNGGGIYCNNTASPILVNSILWDNTPQEIYIGGGTVTATYSDIQGGMSGEGNIDADPLFVDADNDDFHLLWGSPCIDVGDPDLDGDGITWETDLDDQDPLGTRMDMGAFYFSQMMSDFIAEPTVGFLPLDVQFTDNSYPNMISWEWDFDNDGEVDSYEQNPSFTYTQPGFYTVLLTVNDEANEVVEIKNNYIQVYQSNLVITEIMQNPSAVSDNQGEWFEIFNPGDMNVDLIGCIIKDNGTDYHVIDSSLYIEAEHYFVFGENADYDTNGGLNIGYEYSDNSLGNGSDEIILISPQGNLIDSVGWDNGSTFPDPNGASMALFDTVLDNSVGSSWTVSVTPYGDGDLGTPGIPNFNPTVLVSEEEIIFTDVMVGLSDTYNLEITNIGNGGLIIDTVYFDSDVFNPGFTTALVEVGDPILLPIIFTPLAVETYGASLFIETNDYNNQIFSIDMQGYGIEPNPNIYINPDTLDFGVVSIGDSGHVWFTIYNIGVNDLEIEEVQFGQGEDSPFFTDFEEATISSQGDTSVIIHYVYPDQRVVFQDTFYVYSNDPDQSTYALPIMVFTPTNSPPVITSEDSVTANENSYFKYTATATDPEDSTIIFSFDQLASWLAADADSVYGTPSDGDADTSFLVIASDGELGDSLVVFIDVIHINDPPNEFALLTPEAESMIQTLTPLFEWVASFDPDPTDTVSYTLFYGDSIPTLQIIEVGTELSYQVSSDLNDNKTYYWKVIAEDQSGAFTENIGGYQSFYTNLENEPPSSFEILSPNQNSIQTDLSPNFSWTTAVDPDPMDTVEYRLDIMGPPTDTYPWEYFVNTNETNFTPDFSLGDNTTFTCMVNANDMYGETVFAMEVVFHTDSIPEPPLNFATVTPENNAEGIATEVEFIWEQTDDPDPLDEIHYQLVYATDWEDSSTYVYSDLLEDTSLTVTLTDNSQYYWIVVAMDTDGFMVGSNENTPNTMVVGTLSIDGADVPEVFALHQNYPNPFNPTTTLRYDLPEQAHVEIMIYDIMGREVRSLVNNQQNAGFKSVVWDATNESGKPVSAGMYLYRISAGEFHSVKKMVLLK